MDGVELEDIIKATKEHNLEEDEQYKKIADSHKEVVQQLCKVKTDDEDKEDNTN